MELYFIEEVEVTDEINELEACACMCGAASGSGAGIN